MPVQSKVTHEDFRAAATCVGYDAKESVLLNSFLRGTLVYVGKSLGLVTFRFVMYKLYLMNFCTSHLGRMALS